MLPVGFSQYLTHEMDKVKHLQKFLIAHDFYSSPTLLTELGERVVDGFYGPATSAALAGVNRDDNLCFDEHLIRMSLRVYMHDCKAHVSRMCMFISLPVSSSTSVSVPLST